VTTDGAADALDDAKFVPASPFQPPSRPRRLIKYKIPRKRASLLQNMLRTEQEMASKASKPAVFSADFRAGDSIELEYRESMAPGARVDKIRGVVLAKVNRGIASTVVIRDVVLETVIERQIPLHSPLCLTLKVLERNFVKKGKKKIKRAKLFYLRDRPDNEVRVTG
jgi:large subunit ribosomal protein L19